MALLLAIKARTAHLTINRPPLNVLDLALLRELDHALRSISREDGVDVVILRGGGERAFSAGVDVKDHTREKVPEMLEVVHGVIRRVMYLPQVTIASVRGLCLGGGCELATSCDFVIASEDSVFATPEIAVGCYPPVALARFASQIGYHRAVDMILTGRRVSAEEALAMGLVNRVGPAAELARIEGQLVAELTDKSRAVLRLTVKGLRELSGKGFAEALRRSEEIYVKQLLATEDVEEGVRSFVEKRKPQWKHR